MTVAQKPGHGLAYKLTVVPVMMAARGAAYVWRGLVRADVGWREQRKTTPFPLFRWAAGIGILVWTATGTAPHSISGWFTAHLPWLIVAGVLTLAPEVVRIEFGGMKMELLRETRAELRALTNHVTQLQIQQAAASASASAGINQTITGMAAVTEVTAATKQGEETKAVPAQEVDWRLYTRSGPGWMSSPPWGTTPSTDPGPGSTVEE